MAVPRTAPSQLHSYTPTELDIVTASVQPQAAARPQPLSIALNAQTEDWRDANAGAEPEATAKSASSGGDHRCRCWISAHPYEPKRAGNQRPAIPRSAKAVSTRASSLVHTSQFPKPRRLSTETRPGVGDAGPALGDSRKRRDRQALPDEQKPVNRTVTKPRRRVPPRSRSADPHVGAVREPPKTRVA